MNKLNKLIELTSIKLLYLEEKEELLRNNSENVSTNKIDKRILKIDYEFNNTFFDIKKENNIKTLDELKIKYFTELQELKKNIDLIINIEKKINKISASNFYRSNSNISKIDKAHNVYKKNKKF
ncbi:hypothetical protein [Helicovermis profundi]|uniref:Flagellar protein FlgN n=1 Tax=Helicovermis profundi TaxID=3065157 RepID=A0AAU9ES85_9FIRM|nr:hypothetical protein HLPR_02360 [Clostridia bacterium S502]